MRNRSGLHLVASLVTPGPLAEWSQWMRAAGMSARTITDRTQLIARFEDHAGINSIGANWQACADFLAADRFSAGTRQTYHAHMHAWFGWLVLMDYRLDDPTAKLKSPKAPRRRPRPVTIEQLSRILDTRMHARTRVMILLGAYEGLRVSEIAKVRAEHIRGSSFRVIGKGGVDVDLPLHDLIAEHAVSMPQVGLWFPSHVKFGPILGNSVSAMIGDAMERARVPGTPHALRHFFGTECLKASGGNLVLTQQLMRHANIATTAGYTEVDDADRRATVAALPIPLAA
jgi:integrase/recombinase XerD